MNDQKILEEIRIALGQGKDSLRYTDEQGNIVEIKISKVNAGGICEPYD
ncbi:hypothetical protein J4457_02005 [Candidatus Woesearchaeota archaeon]|nr:hypothetical protein [Candidatus Woesearchaeota archaeon]